MMGAIFPVVLSMQGIAAATLDQSGTVLEGNSGLYRLLTQFGFHNNDKKITAFFIQPSFPDLWSSSPIDGRLVYE